MIENIRQVQPLTQYKTKSMIQGAYGHFNNASVQETTKYSASELFELGRILK